MSEKGETMEKVKALLRCWPFHLTVLLITVMCEAVNTISIPVGTGSLMFLPMLFAMVIGADPLSLKTGKNCKEKRICTVQPFCGDRNRHFSGKSCGDKRYTAAGCAGCGTCSNLPGVWKPGNDSSGSSAGTFPGI